MASTLEKRSSASLSEKGLDRVDDRTLGERENENEEVGETLHRGLQARQISMIAVRVSLLLYTRSSSTSVVLS